MNDRMHATPQDFPVANYGSAVARALEWLGDRYLLAKPINARKQPRGRTAAIKDFTHGAVKSL